MGEILGPWVKTLRSEPARSFPKTRGERSFRLLMFSSFSQGNEWRSRKSVA